MCLWVDETAYAFLLIYDSHIEYRCTRTHEFKKKNDRAKVNRPCRRVEVGQPQNRLS